MSAAEANQTGEFESQSLRFVQEHMHDSTPAPEWVLTSSHLRDGRIKTVLDVGCGAGVLLKSVVENFNATTGVGVEPSTEAVALLDRTYEGDERVSFRQGTINKLPFETDSFDLVMCWSVLHWVGRNEYLQALGELIRVTREHLLIMDFVAAADYRVPYRHSEGLFTYKQDFVPAVMASGVMSVVEDHRWWDGHVPGAVRPVLEADLQPLTGNPLNYHARRGVLFVKDYSTLPVHVEADFTA